MSNYINKEETLVASKPFGALVAFEYVGKNSRIKQIQRVLQYLEKRRQRAKGGRPKRVVLGEIQPMRHEDGFHFTAVNGEKFRIPYNAQGEGIYDYFDVDFKRVSE